MNTLRIGVDLDGVVFQTLPVFLNEIKNRWGIDATPKQITEFKVAKCIPISRKNCREIYSDPNYIKNLSPFQGIHLLLNFLKYLGLEIHIVTARKPRLLDVTQRSLRQNQIPYDFLVLKKDKAKYARKNRLHYFIEDRYKNTIALANLPGMKTVFLHDAPYNRNRPIPENVHRYTNWHELFPVIGASIEEQLREEFYRDLFR